MTYQKSRVSKGDGDIKFPNGHLRLAPWKAFSEMGFGLLKKETATCQYHTLAPYITSQIFNYTSLLPSAQPTAIHIHIRSSWTNSCILFFPFPTTFPPPTLRAVAFVPLLSNSLTQYTHPSLGEEEGYSSSCHELCEFFSSTRRKPFELIHHLSSSTTIYLLHHHHHHQCMHSKESRQRSSFSFVHS